MKEITTEDNGRSKKNKWKIPTGNERNLATEKEERTRKDEQAAFTRNIRFFDDSFGSTAQSLQFVK